MHLLVRLALTCFRWSKESNIPYVTIANAWTYINNGIQLLKKKLSLWLQQHVHSVYILGHNRWHYTQTTAHYNSFRKWQTATKCYCDGLLNYNNITSLSNTELVRTIYCQIFWADQPYDQLRVGLIILGVGRMCKYVGRLYNMIIS